MSKLKIFLILGLVIIGLVTFIKIGKQNTDVVKVTEEKNMETNKINIQIGERILTATLVDNSSVDALKQALLKNPIEIKMRDYANMEKVGRLGINLPTNDQQINTEAGDLILYQGNSFVIYYGPNSWNFTKLGKIDDIGAEELKEILGSGNVNVTLSLPNEFIINTIKK